MQRVKIWDLPTRLFHWAIVLLVIAAWCSQELDRMELHVLIGYTILALVIFRIIWGFIGSDTARFTQFLHSPLKAFRHLSHLTRREEDREVGHNAAGGWMVLLMLLLLGIQAGTGLFANDDGNTEGPLMHFVSKAESDYLSHIHSLNFDLIEIVVALHILAILAYAILKRHDLVRPMVTGVKSMPDGVIAPRLVSPVRAILALAVAAGLVAWVVRL